MEGVKPAFPTSSEPGWMEVMGLRLTTTGADEVRAEMELGPQHHQPFGLVHGGVYASIVETVCSIGATLNAPPGFHVVGMDNHTSFLRPMTEGLLRAVATPLQRGRRTQLWDALIYNADGQLVASGRLLLMNVPARASGGAAA